MNERIKELEDQCWVQVPCDFDMRKGGLSTINTVFDRKKFVELIVRECAETMGSEIVYNVNYYERNRAISDMITLVKKHFGVEYTGVE